MMKSLLAISLVVSFSTFAKDNTDQRLNNFVGKYTLVSSTNSNSCVEKIEVVKECKGLIIKKDNFEDKSFCNINKSKNGFNKLETPIIPIISYDKNKVTLDKDEDTITSTSSSYLIFGKVGTYISILKKENSETLSLNYQDIDTPTQDTNETCTYTRE